MGRRSPSASIFRTTIHLTVIFLMENTQVSVQILLPKLLNQRLARWAKDAPGASWPTWGGHITLIPPFHPLVSYETLEQAVASVCVRYQPIDLRMTDVVSVPDWTREGYRAVLLRPPDPESDDSVQRLAALRTEMVQALSDMGVSVKPGLLGRPFAPHITLALSVSEMEADHMVSQIRAKGLAVEFTVDRVWLLQFDGSHNGGTLVERRDIPLGMRWRDILARKAKLSAQ